MWNILVVAVMVGLTGFYSLNDSEALASVQRARGEDLAQNMALYRQAVVAYFSKHPTGKPSVSITELKNEGLLPEWSTLSTNPEACPWDNYRVPNGMIYVYAAMLPQVNIVADLVNISYRSPLVGVFTTDDATLQSPIYGSTGIDLPPQVANKIPNGSPVWVASLH